MKKIIAMVICLVIVLSLVGCGKNAPINEKLEVQNIRLTQIDMDCLQQITEFTIDSEIRGYSGGEAAQPDLSSLKLISPNESDSICLISGVSLTGFGLVDGRLHVQVLYNDILNTDNHGRVYLKKPDGSIVQSENSISFWAEDHIDSYDEYVFPALEDNQYNCEVWGEFWTR